MGATYYAEINQEGKCLGLSQLASDFVKLSEEEFKNIKIGMLYDRETGTWSEPTQPEN
jgi:hypothetical protein